MKRKTIVTVLALVMVTSTTLVAQARPAPCLPGEVSVTVNAPFSERVTVPLATDHSLQLTYLSFEDTNFISFIVFEANGDVPAWGVNSGAILVNRDKKVLSSFDHRPTPLEDGRIYWEVKKNPRGKIVPSQRVSSAVFCLGQ